MRVWENQGVSFEIGAQLRARDFYNELQRWQGSAKLNYQWFEHTSLSLGFATLEDNIGRTGSQIEYRIYPAISHTVALTTSLDLKIRNRIDFRKREFEEDFANRSRHRIGLQYDLPDWGPLDYVFASDEFYINWDTGNLDQNRIIPAGLGFRISETLTMEAYYLLRLDDNGGRWDRTHVLGTHLKIKF